MKKLLFAALALFLLAPALVFAASDTLTVYASTGLLDAAVRKDTLVNGTRAHHVYKLVSTDTTYIFDATMTVNSDIAFIGVPKAGTGKLPCIQPDVLGDLSIPGVFFTLTGQHTTGTFKNLYLLGIAINNKVNYASGQGIQVTADSVKIVVDNVIFEQMSQFAIGYAGSMCKFFITNSKFRNMTTQPNQYYVGELLRNENYVAPFKTDSIVIKYNTMLCVSGYATAATGGLVRYYEFSHNDVVFTFKNVFFLDRMVNAKFNNNIFYCTYAGGQSKAEYSGGWDSFTAGTVASIITTGPLDSTTAALLLGHASTGAGDPAAELLRKVEVKNNVYFWPAAMTAYWHAWDDTAHVDSIYTPVWMNAQSINMFSNKTLWPGFVESGTQNVDPGFGASIPGTLNPGMANANGVGLLNWFAAVRLGTGTTETYGYKITQVGTAANWTPTWPLPESAEMQYALTALKTGATDGGPIGDPNWFGMTLGVKQEPASRPLSFTLSQNYPNPFNPATKIQFTIPAAQQVTLRVFNLLGQEVATLVNGPLTAGTHEVSFDASRLASGVYMYKIIAGEYVSAKKMLLLK
jgi:hypothetical protein